MAALTWYRLVFYIPLAIGVLMALGLAMGLTSLPHGVDVDGDGSSGSLDHDLSHDHSGGQDHAGWSLLSVLGFGKVPALLLVMSMCLIFGGTGTISNLLLASSLKVSELFALYSLAIAFLFTFSLTGVIARTIGRVMPTLETTSVGKQDLIGCEGVITLDTGDSEGLAQVTKDGDIYQVKCRSVEPLARGSKVLVTDYNVTQEAYDVCRYPLG